MEKLLLLQCLFMVLNLILSITFIIKDKSARKIRIRSHILFVLSGIIFWSYLAYHHFFKEGGNIGL